MFFLFSFLKKIVFGHEYKKNWGGFAVEMWPLYNMLQIKEKEEDL